MQRTKGNLQLMKEINMAAILNLLHRERLLSRAEITSITKLSATTVSALVEELIASQIVEEIGERPSAGAGRKAIALQINRQGGYVIGISLGSEHIQYAIVDLYGDIVEEFRKSISFGNDAVSEQVLSAALQCAERAAELHTGALKGIGVSIPGIIDEAGESVIYSSYLKLDSLNIKKLMASRFPDVSFRLINDSNAAAFAEHYNGVGAGKSHLLYLSIHEGIGAGLILNKQIFSGYQGGAGEIGHIPVDPHGRKCSCGRIGCIETVITTPFILEELQNHARTIGVEPPKSLDVIVDQYEAGTVSDSIFDKFISVLALMIRTAVNFLSPEVVILEGWMTRSSKIMEKLKLEVLEIPTSIPFKVERILTSSYGEKGPLYGAAVLMLQQVFKTTTLA